MSDPAFPGGPRERQFAASFIASLSHEGVDDSRLAELFDILNETYFDGVLPRVPLHVGIPEEAEGDNLGLTRWQFVPSLSIDIFLSDWLFTIEDPGIRWEMITEKLLHEMVHLAVDLDALGGAGRFEAPIHGARFTAECNRIGEPRGWGVVEEDEEEEGYGPECWPSTRELLGDEGCQELLPRKVLDRIADA